MIKRYFATKDNTITNAFDPDMTTRGTGSNMGQSDILETFTVYGQVSSSSGLQREVANILLQFDTSQIAADKTSGAISSGSSFYLKLFNARHSQTLPRDFTLQVLDLTQEWQEGLGLDMENYTDLTYDIRGSNWIMRTGAPVTEVTKFTFISDTPANYDAASGANYIKLYNMDTLVNLWFDNGSATTPGGTNIETTVTDLGNKEAIAEAFKVAVAANSNFSANVISNVVYVTASVSGMATATPVNVGDLTTAVLLPEVWNAGNGSWRTEGGASGSVLASAEFPIGNENLEVDITTCVNSWIDGTKVNNGLVIRLASTEADENRSYYTKMFFGRNSHNWFEKPVLEARWDSATTDDRGAFHLSSSLVTAEDNINTIYLYNYARGRLTNIPSVNTDNKEIMVSIFSGSSANTGPSGSALQLVVDANSVVSTNDLVVTGGWVSKGIYSASFAYTGSSTIENVYDVWFSGSNSVLDASVSSMQFSTGSIEVKRFSSLQYSYTPKYVFAISNKNQDYYHDQIHRIRLYAREKNWSPNIYTTATTVPNSLIFNSASYQVSRVVDNKIVIPYNTSSTQATRLSYDVSGNYFDLDCSMFEPNYQYGIKFSIYDPDTLTYEEQPFTYNLRVVKNES